MGHRSKHNHHETDKDEENSLAVTGRYQLIPPKPGKDFHRPTLAAGAVVWRGEITDPEIALIHRPHYDDWSLPKGKLDPGESLPVTAAREIREETGFEVHLEKLLGNVSYPVLDRTKVVWYWTARWISGEFTPNDEVDVLEWVHLPEAFERITYEVDSQVLGKAEKRFRLHADTRILYVRHAHAHDRGKWNGNDDLRPLDKKGRRQAEFLSPLLTAYGPTEIYSAVPDRCQQTAAPLAARLDVPVTVDPLLGDDVWLTQPEQAQERFVELASSGGVKVVVAQGTIIPAMIEWLSSRGKLPVTVGETKKGSTFVLSFQDGELTGADYLASAMPVR